MALTSPAVTQIIYLVVPTCLELGGDSEAGRTWSSVQDIIENTPGFRRLYWGRRLEEPDNVQLHIVRSTIEHHIAFLSSATYQKQLLPVFDSLTQSSVPPNGTPNLFVRHAKLQEYTKDCKALGRAPGMPIGTAIYVGTDAAWDHAWPLWTHIVRYVDGCRGVSGGKVIESVAGFERNYIVYVGWESVRHHDDYHHTEHFAKRWIVLNQGNQGWKEYGHVIFQDGRERASSTL